MHRQLPKTPLYSLRHARFLTLEDIDKKAMEAFDHGDFEMLADAPKTPSYPQGGPIRVPSLKTGVKGGSPAQETAIRNTPLLTRCSI